MDEWILEFTRPLYECPKSLTKSLRSALEFLNLTNKNMPQQECIPVGCVPPTAVAIRGVSTRHPPPREQEPPRGQTHTYKHITLPQTSFAGDNYCLQHKISITSNNCIQSGLLKSDPGHLKLPSRGPVGPFTFKSQRHPCDALAIMCVEQVDSLVSVHVVCEKFGCVETTRCIPQ